jgi:hypothetical protein
MRCTGLYNVSNRRIWTTTCRNSLRSEIVNSAKPSNLQQFAATEGTAVNIPKRTESDNRRCVRPTQPTTSRPSYHGTDAAQSTINNHNVKHKVWHSCPTNTGSWIVHDQALQHNYESYRSTYSRSYPHKLQSSPVCTRHDRHENLSSTHIVHWVRRSMTRPSWEPQQYPYSTLSPQKHWAPITTQLHGTTSINQSIYCWVTSSS